MAGFYQDFTSTRITLPHFETLVAQLRALDGSIGVAFLGEQQYRIKKNTEWTAQHRAIAQNVLDTCPSITPQLIAQAEIDAWPISIKAFVLALIDQLNVLRARGNQPLPPITPAQALQAIRDKAGTL